MASLVVLGAAGFLGRSLLAAVDASVRVKAVARRSPEMLAAANVEWIAADLLAPQALRCAVERDDIVLNLAYLGAGSDRDNLRLADNVTESCIGAKAARLVHCSTAVVVGGTRQKQIDETTTCEPATSYERTKWAVEQRILAALPKGLDVGLLRPTAIVGAGGQNLLKLADSLRAGNPMVNYARASLFGARAMHLVPVRNVVAALLHMARLPVPLAGGIYQVAADDDPDNNFRRVEQLLRQALGMPSRGIPVVPIPTAVLSTLLRALGRSDTSVSRYYDSCKLRASGFVPPDRVENAIRDFVASLSLSVSAR